MKNLVRNSRILVLAAMICAVPVIGLASDTGDAPNSAVINRIDGIVWDPYRRPVSDVNVELQNELLSTIARVRTSSTGRFSFTVRAAGNYVVKVLASGTNYMDASEPAELVNVTQMSSDAVYLDIYLKFDKRKLDTGLAGITEAVYIQDVPSEARKLFEVGKNDVRGNKVEGFATIDQALKIFPDYFEALNFVGREYVQRKEYQKSLEYLIRSINVNQRSYSSFYSLAYAAYQLGQRPEATEAARGAVILEPNSVNAQLLYGTLLRLNGDYEKAEKALLQAEKLSKNTAMPELHWQMALLYNKMDRNKEAAAQLETYMKQADDVKNKKEVQELIAKLKNSKK